MWNKYRDIHGAYAITIKTRNIVDFFGYKNLISSEWVIGWVTVTHLSTHLIGD